MKGVFLLLAVEIAILGVQSQVADTCLSSYNIGQALTMCTSCPASYHYVLQEGSFKCQACAIGCLACSTSTSCLACNTLLTSPSVTCVACPPNCLQCETTPTTVCTVCMQGYILNNTNCVVPTTCSIQKCATCTITQQNNKLCTVCNQSNYFASPFGCIPCNQTCLTCSFNSTDAWSLISPYWNNKLSTIYNVTDPLVRVSHPRILNYFNTTNMTQTQKIGWIYAYYAHFTYVKQMPTGLTVDTMLKNGVQFIQSIYNYTDANKILGIVAMLNKITNKTYTANQILTNIYTYMANNITKCLSCLNGYYVDTSINKCMACNRTCTTCTSFNACTSCVAPLVLEGTVCQKCKLPCMTCLSSNTSKCVTCISPYSQLANSSNICYYCSQLSCKKCNADNTSICTQCVDGLVLTNSLCQLCPANCTKCQYQVQTRQYICTACKDTYYLYKSRCSPCKIGCAACALITPSTNTTKCTTCMSTFYLNPTTLQCNKCKPQCKQCASADSCTLLQDGIVMIDAKAVQCRPGCKVCSSAAPQLCTQCMGRYYLQASICKTCGVACLQCSSSTTCSKCIDGYVIVRGTCNSCPANCIACNSARTTCTACKRGATLVSGQCKYQCQLGCQQCSSTDATKCVTCAHNYALKPDTGKCIKCLSSCSGSCDSKNVSICLSCLAGYQLIENKCVRCSFGCSMCAKQQCLQCSPGFKLVLNQTNYYVCVQTCNYPCNNCTWQSCRGCQNGYTLDNGSCIPDISCNPTCSFCRVGTQKNTLTGSCELCPLNCASCSGGTCQQCFDGYYKNGNKCTQCAATCKTCFDGSACILCGFGYTKQILSIDPITTQILYGDKCVACDSNCKTCGRQPTLCTSCNDGYRLYSYRCANLYNVRYTYKINIPYSQFLSQSKSQAFIAALATKLNINSTDNYIIGISEGSTQIQGSISASNSGDATTVQNNMNSDVSGFDILSFGSTVFFGDTQRGQSDPDAPTVQQQQQTTNNIPMIIGAAIGGFALICIIAFIVYKCKTRAPPVIEKQVVQQKQQSKQNGTSIMLTDFDGTPQQYYTHDRIIKPRRKTKRTRI